MTKNESKVDSRRECPETCWKQRSTNEERKGATKIEPKKQNEKIMSKGVDETKQEA